MAAANIRRPLPDWQSWSPSGRRDWRMVHPRVHTATAPTSSVFLAPAPDAAIRGIRPCVFESHRVAYQKTFSIEDSRACVRPTESSGRFDRTGACAKVHRHGDARRAIIAAHESGRPETLQLLGRIRRYGSPFGEPESPLVWHRGYHTALAVCPGWGDTGGTWAAADHRRDAGTARPRHHPPGDVVGIGIHTGNALRGYEIGRLARERGATVVFGGIHATLYPEEAHELGGAHAVVKGDGDVAWPQVLDDAAGGRLQRVYEAGRVDADRFVPARWDLLPEGRYMWGSVQTVRGCPKHCSFCSVWRTDGQKPRQRGVDAVVGEIVELRRRGFRFVALADDNFYPVALADLAMAERQNNKARLEQLLALRAERFELMERLAQLPPDMIFFTQITMEAAEDDAFLAAMKRANIKGALVGVEAVTPEGLKDVYKGFNESGEALVTRLRKFKDHGVHVLGSFIFGLPSDRPATFDATADVAERAGVTFAQFVMLTPFPGHAGFRGVGKDARTRHDPHCRNPDHAALADPAGEPSEGLHAAPGDVW